MSLDGRTLELATVQEFDSAEFEGDVDTVDSSDAAASPHRLPHLLEPAH